MIRRETRLANGTPGWALISQQEHARVSARLLPLLQNLPGRVDDRRQFVEAVAHHDDGWPKYDARPELDERGRPRSFTEMRLETSLAIWSESIDAAERIGPLAAWLVASHFHALLSGGQSQHKEPAAQVWLDTIDARCSDWLAAWGGAREVADEALGLLQMLDAASLWICCGCPAKGDQMMPRPEPFDSLVLGLECTGPGQITASGAGRSAVSLQLSARGAEVDATRYDSPESLQSAATPRSWQWAVAPPTPRAD